MGDPYRPLHDPYTEADEPITATQLKKAQNIDITQAAFTLNELWKKKLVQCLNPEDHHGKVFIISPNGKDVWESSKIHGNNIKGTFCRPDLINQIAKHM